MYEGWDILSPAEEKRLAIEFKAELLKRGFKLQLDVPAEIRTELRKQIASKILRERRVVGGELEEIKTFNWSATHKYR
jgi:hypothetical protein